MLVPLYWCTPMAELYCHFATSGMADQLQAVSVIAVTCMNNACRGLV